MLLFPSALGAQIDVDLLRFSFRDPAPRRFAVVLSTGGGCFWGHRIYFYALYCASGYLVRDATLSAFLAGRERQDVHVLNK